MNVALSIVVLLLFVFLVGKLCGRILGVRLGRWRGFLVGIIGWLVGVAATVVVLGHKAGDGWELTIKGLDQTLIAIGVILFVGVLAAMPTAIVLDVLTRRPISVKPRRRRRRFLRPIRTAKAALAPYSRLREVAGNARRANLLQLRYASASALQSPDFAVKIRSVLEESGGMLVKFGQIASTRTDILPDTLTDELAKLRADARRVDETGVRGVLEAELPAHVDELFGSFEWTPLAAASIGQTHRATLTNGERVVVKVQRPGIDEVIARDAAVLRLVARQLERRVEAARAIGLRALAEELIAGVEKELDYVHEAVVGMKLREQRAHDVGIAVPGVHPSLSTGRVLVMDEVPGRSTADAAALDESPVARPELARRLLSSFLGQVLQDGLYHADPHPGNMMIDSAGTIWLLDFGSVGRLDPIALEGLRGIAIGVAAQDAGVLVRAVRDLAGGDGLTDLRALETDLAGQLAHANGSGIDPAMITQVLAIMDRHDLRPPATITLLARALLTIEGTLKIIDPAFDLATTSQEMVNQDHRGAFGTPQEILQREVLRVLPSLRTLPDHAETIASQLRLGRLSVRTERFAGRDREVVEDWIDRIALVAIGGFGVIAAAIVLFAASMTSNRDLEVTLRILGFGGLLLCSVLLMRVAAGALRRNLIRRD
ncbi:MAG: AarF/ABC1/UbiB kinase family protein [Actinobacteria bacterium]|nr:AarF/ABC1/UbiB kinase family protein [Actinomycetota bacterium]